jgi:hypothetical protein
LLPLALGYAAALVKAYPFGGSRLYVYVAPGLLLLIAEGSAATFEWLKPRTRLATGVVFMLLLVAPACAAYRMIAPWPREDFALATTYIRNHRQSLETVLANKPIEAYYFRHMTYTVTSVSASSEQIRTPLWAIATGEGRSERLEKAKAMVPAGWAVDPKKDFFRTTVVLLRPTGPG